MEFFSPSLFYFSLLPLPLRPPNLSDVDPALDDPRPDVRPQLPVLEHGADHAGRHGVELRDGGADGGGAVLVVLLVPLGPDGAQAVVRHHLLEQQLKAKERADVSSTGLTSGDLSCPASNPTARPPALSAPFSLRLTASM